MERKRNLISRKGFISQRKLAKVLDITTRWIRHLEARGVLKKEFGKYEKDGSTTAYINFLRKSKDKTLAEAQRIHLETKTKKLKLEARILEGELVPATQAQETLSKAGSEFESGYKSMGWRLAHVLVRVKDEYPDDGDYEKFCKVLIDRMVTDMIREVFFRIPKGTPNVFPWEWELVKVGAILPDQDGNILYHDTKGARLMLAVDLVKQGEEVNEKFKNRNSEGDPEGMVSGSRDPEAT